MPKHVLLSLTTSVTWNTQYLPVLDTYSLEHYQRNLEYTVPPCVGHLLSNTISVTWNTQYLPVLDTLLSLTLSA